MAGVKVAATARRGWRALAIFVSVSLLVPSIASASEWVLSARGDFLLCEPGSPCSGSITSRAVAFVPSVAPLLGSPRVVVGSGSSYGDGVRVYEADRTGMLRFIRTYDVPGSVVDLALGLANADSLYDLIAATEESIWVAFASGYGEFDGEPDTYPVAVASGPTALAVGAINSGDDRCDIVVANGAGGTATVLMNDGTGTFTQSQVLATGTGHSYGVALGDFNCDSLPDLAIACGAPGRVRVMPNTGDTLLPFSQGQHTDHSVKGIPHSIVSGDFNRDGDDDLAVTLGALGRIAVLDMPCISPAARRPDDFQAEITWYSLGVTCAGLTAADFDGDGCPDLAVAGRGVVDDAPLPTGQCDTEDDVFLLLSQGRLPRTRLSSPRPLLVHLCPHDLASGSLDGDALPDVLVGYSEATEANQFVSVLRGDGGEGLLSASGLHVNGWVFIFDVADVDGDGDQDLVLPVGQYGDDGRVFVMAGDGWGAFTELAVLEPDVSIPLTMTAEAARVDTNDAFMDIVVARRGGGSQLGEVAIYRGTGVGAWESTPSTKLQGCGALPWDVEVGLFDDDDCPDIAVASTGASPVNGGVRVFWGPGFNSSTNLHSLWGTDKDVFHLAAADIDGDGFTDLAAVECLVGPGGSSGTLHVFRGPLGHHWSTHIVETCHVPAEPTGVAIGDLNGDGLQDAVVGLGGFGVAVYLADPDWHGVWSNLYGAPSVYSIDSGVGSSLFFPQIADMDADGQPDIVCAIHYESRQICVWRGLGNGVFEEPPRYYGVHTYPNRAVVAQIDSNADSAWDVVVSHEAGASMPVNNILVCRGLFEQRGATLFEVPATVAREASTGTHLVANPSRRPARLSFAVPGGGARVQLAIYDLAGRLVRRLVDQEYPAGTFSVDWRGDTEQGTEAGSGVYFCRTTVGTDSSVSKLTLLR